MEKQDIKMKDVEALREHFDKFCEKYRHKNECSQIYIKFLYSNLLKDIYGSIDGTGEADLNKDVEKMYMTTDFQSLTGLVEVAIDRLAACFEDKSQTGHKEVEIVKQYIYRNYGSELGIDMLADMVYLAPSYLSTVFKKETGQNLSKFIKSYRMERARDMLENSMAKIVDIGAMCGYQNVSYFCSSFREFYGVSPQKFRESGVAGGVYHFFFKKWRESSNENLRRHNIVTFVFCLLLSFVAEICFGVADITGAFVAGLAVSGLKKNEYVVNRFNTLSYMLLSPIFFANIGLAMTLKGLTKKLVIFMLLLMLLAVVTKVIGCGLGAKIMRYTNKESLQIGIGMISRGEVALIVANKGASVGLMSEKFMTPLVIMVVFTTIVTPILLKLVFPKRAPPSGRC